MHARCKPEPLFTAIVGNMAMSPKGIPSLVFPRRLARRVAHTFTAFARALILNRQSAASSSKRPSRQAGRQTGGAKEGGRKEGGVKRKVSVKEGGREGVGACAWQDGKGQVRSDRGDIAREATT